MRVPYCTVLVRTAPSTRTVADLFFDDVLQTIRTVHQCGGRRYETLQILSDIQTTPERTERTSCRLAAAAGYTRGHKVGIWDYELSPLSPGPCDLLRIIAGRPSTVLVRVYYRTCTDARAGSPGQALSSLNSIPACVSFMHVHDALSILFTLCEYENTGKIT